MLVAVGAADPVDVMRALCVGEGRVHLFDIESAIGHLWMAGFAGGCRVLVVAGVAGETADAFMFEGLCLPVRYRRPWILSETMTLRF